MNKKRPLTGSKRLATDNIVIDPVNFSGILPHVPKLGTIKDAKLALASAHFAGSPEAIQREVYRRFPELDPRNRKEQKTIATNSKIIVQQPPIVLSGASLDGNSKEQQKIATVRKKKKRARKRKK